MAQLIAGSIDLTKIDKSKIIEGKNGAKYYNITISVNDTKDKFDNDAAIIQGQSKEERENKTPKIYLGNAKIIWSSEKTQEANTVQETHNTQNSQNNDDLPF